MWDNNPVDCNSARTACFWAWSLTRAARSLCATAARSRLQQVAAQSPEANTTSHTTSNTTDWRWVNHGVGSVVACMSMNLEGDRTDTSTTAPAPSVGKQEHVGRRRERRRDIVCKDKGNVW